MAKSLYDQLNILHPTIDDREEIESVIDEVKSSLYHIEDDLAQLQLQLECLVNDFETITPSDLKDYMNQIASKIYDQRTKVY